MSDVPDVWARCLALVGTWRGSGSGEPGESEGAFSFEAELQGKAIIRRNRTTYPTFVHEDLLVAWRDGAAVRAFYLDSEGHAIGYRVEPWGERGVSFLSEPSAGGPRFRLRYRPEGADAVHITFEIAPPDETEAFHEHVAGDAVRAR